VLKMHEMRELIKLVDQSSITDFEYEYEGSKVSMKKSVGKVLPSASVEFEEGTPVLEPEAKVGPTPSVVPEKVQAPEVNNEPTIDTAGLHKIESPMVGTFYSSPSPDADVYVKAGDKVNDSSVVCIVEAMKLMNEIEAEVRGEIVEVLVENGQLVEYGQALFLVKPE
jgi:acetyl-CoA carboxylase biotin carboxyl carrier protein